MEKGNYAHKISLFVAKTGVLLALTITFQWLGSIISGGNQLIVGSLVNMMLFLSVMLVGFFGAAIIGFCTPFVAILFGVASMPAFPIIIPFIALGNFLFVSIFFLLMIVFKKNKYLKAAAIAVAACVKWIYLSIIMVPLIFPMIIPQAPAKAMAVFAITFGITQLFTALIGGALAYIITFKLSKKYLKY